VEREIKGEEGGTRVYQWATTQILSVGEYKFVKSKGTDRERGREEKRTRGENKERREHGERRKEEKREKRLMNPFSFASLSFLPTLFERFPL
jgi:hypothetical protein